MRVHRSKLGVRDMDDLAVVEDTDLKFFGLNAVQRRRFLQLADRQAWSYHLQQVRAPVVAPLPMH